MVAITRSAAARQQQSSNTNYIVLPVGVNKVCSKKKKTVKQRAPLPNKSSSTEPAIETATITPEICGMFTFL